MLFGVLLLFVYLATNIAVGLAEPLDPGTGPVCPPWSQVSAGPLAHLPQSPAFPPPPPLIPSLSLRGSGPFSVWGTPGSFNCPCTSWASGNLKGLENHSTASTAHSSTRRSGKLLTDPVQPFVLVWFCLGRGSSPHCVWISQHLGHPPSPGQGVLWWTMDGQCFTTTQYARDNQHHFIDREIGPSEGGAE